MIAFSAAYFLSGAVFDLGIRSQIVTYVFFLFLAFVLKKIGEGKQKYIYLIPPLFIVWVNTHIGFFSGFILLFPFSAYSLWRYPKIRWSRILAIASAISFLATWINPFGWHVYVEIYRHAVSPLASMIAEWTPPDTITRLSIVLLTAGVFAIRIYFKKIRALEMCLLIIFALMSYLSRRNIPFFYTLFFLDVLHLIPRSWKIPNEISLPLLSAAIAVAMIARTPATISSFDWKNYCFQGITHYPCELTNKLNLKGNIFTNYEWGGYFIWKQPGTKVFVDGRMPAWHSSKGTSPYKTYLDVVQTNGNWNTFLHANETNFLVISPNTFLDAAIAATPRLLGWKQLFRNDFVVVYSSIGH